MKEIKIANENKNPISIVDVFLESINIYVEASKREEYNKNVYLLYSYYNALSKLLNLFFEDPLFTPEVNANYLRLCVRIEKILNKPGFEELAKLKWRPFPNLSPMVSELPTVNFQSTFWKLYQPQCMEFLNIITEIHIKNGDEEFPIDEDDLEFLENIELYIQNYEKKVKKTSETRMLNFWKLIHPEIVKVSKYLFEGGHYSQAVLAAFTEMDNKIKIIYKNKTGNELSGKNLMNQAFKYNENDSNSPCIKIDDDLSSQDGLNRQQGYQHIFAGSMQAIRNIKAHNNLKITEEDGIHSIFLASMLMNVLDNSQY